MRCERWTRAVGGDHFTPTQVCNGVLLSVELNGSLSWLLLTSFNLASLCIWSNHAFDLVPNSSKVTSWRSFQMHLGLVESVGGFMAEWVGEVFFVHLF